MKVFHKHYINICYSLSMLSYTHQVYFTYHGPNLKLVHVYAVHNFSLLTTFQSLSLLSIAHRHTIRSITCFTLIPYLSLIPNL